MDRIGSRTAGRAGAPGQPCEVTRREPYWAALDAALMILEQVDTLPKSNLPVRLATVLGIVLDVIHEAEKQREVVQHDR